MEQLIEFILQLTRRVKHREGLRRDCEPDRRYSDWLLIRIWMACALKKCSLNTFYALLQCNGTALRRMWRLPNRMPSRGVVYARWGEKSFQRRLREFFEEATREAVQRTRPEECDLLAIDLTALEASYRDKGAGGGHSSQKWTFWGYKLALVVTRAGIPLAFRLMKANWTEGTCSRPLIREGKRRLRDVKRLGNLRYLTADKGYDSEKNYRETAHGCNARMVCPGRKRKYKKKVKHPEARKKSQKARPFRTAALKFYDSPEGQEVFRGRTIVEQINSQLKADPVGITRLPSYVRGLRRVSLWCLGKLLFLTLGICANRAQGRTDRSLKAYVA